jgi:hypothetical protein
MGTIACWLVEVTDQREITGLELDLGDASFRNLGVRVRARHLERRLLGASGVSRGAARPRNEGRYGKQDQ